MEFGEGILPKLISVFCSSPYIEQKNYMETLVELQEAFYELKKESMDVYSDDEILECMVAVFSGKAQGSIEYLLGTLMEELCRSARMGYDRREAVKAGDLL